MPKKLERKLRKIEKNWFNDYKSSPYMIEGIGWEEYKSIREEFNKVNMSLSS